MLSALMLEGKTAGDRNNHRAIGKSVETSSFLRWTKCKGHRKGMTSLGREDKEEPQTSIEKGCSEDWSPTDCSLEQQVADFLGGCAGPPHVRPHSSHNGESQTAGAPSSQSPQKESAGTWWGKERQSSEGHKLEPRWTKGCRAGKHRHLETRNEAEL